MLLPAPQPNVARVRSWPIVLNEPQMLTVILTSILLEIIKFTFSKKEICTICKETDFLRIAMHFSQTFKL